MARREATGSVRLCDAMGGGQKENECNHLLDFIYKYIFAHIHAYQCCHLFVCVRSTHQPVQTSNVCRPNQCGVVLSGQYEEQTGRGASIGHHVEQATVRAALIELAGRQSIEQVANEGGNVQPKGQEPPVGMEDHEDEADDGQDDAAVTDEVRHVQEDISGCCCHV